MARPYAFLTGHPGLLVGLALCLAGCTRYDHDKPDAPANRAGFETRLGIKPGPDVKGVYYYADEMGADCKYQLRFECSQATVDSIAGRRGLAARRPPHRGSGAGMTCPGGRSHRSLRFLCVGRSTPGATTFVSCGTMPNPMRRSTLNTACETAACDAPRDPWSAAGVEHSETLPVGPLTRPAQR